MNRATLSELSLTNPERYDIAVDTIERNQRVIPEDRASAPPPAQPTAIAPRWRTRLGAPS